MAISAPVKSAQYTNIAATPPAQNPSRDIGLVHIAYAKLAFTAAGYTSAASGDISLLRLPQGKLRFLGALSRIICPAGTSTADLDIGYAAHVNDDGTAVSASNAGLADSLDVGGAAINAAIDTAVKTKEFNSKAGVDIVCSFDTANSPDSGDLEIWIAYTHGG
jgi:hypothetical protein